MMMLGEASLLATAVLISAVFLVAQAKRVTDVEAQETFFSLSDDALRQHFQQLPNFASTSMYLSMLHPQINETANVSAFFLFAASWCRSCRPWAEAWTEVHSRFHGHSNVTVISVDCSQSSGAPICSDFGVDTVPQVKYYHRVSNSTSSWNRTYDGAPDIDSISKWVHVQESKTQGDRGIVLSEIDENSTSFECAWRQSAGCDGNSSSQRFPAYDRPCGALIAEGNYGYCECQDGNITQNVSVACDHGPLICNDVCQPSEVCDGWRQTSQCDPYGTVEKNFSCSYKIPSGASGFCACKNGTHIGHMTCAQTELIRKDTSINCKTICASGAMTK